MLKFVRWLFGVSQSLPGYDECALASAQAARSAARQAYLDAWTRGDTRDMHRAELKLKSATLAELMASRGIAA